jgi:hypothetical protein
VFFQSPDGRLSQIRKISPLNVSPINQDADGNIIGTAAFDIVSKSAGGRNYLDQVAIQPDMYGIVPVLGKKIVMQVADQNLPPHLKRMRDTDGADEIVEQTSRVAASPFNDDHSELDQFVKEEWNRDRRGNWEGTWEVEMGVKPFYKAKIKAPTADFAVDKLRKRGVSGIKDATDDELNVRPGERNELEDRDQPSNEGWNDFAVDGYRYEPWEEEEFDRDNKKIHHSVRTPTGEVVSVDWDPYEYMEPGDLKSWIDVGMPTRQHAGTIGPLRADHLDKLAAQKKTVDETSFADAGEVVGGIVGGPAAFALAKGRGGKKTYAAGSVAGSAIGNAAGRWIDNKIAPAAGVDQHGPGPMTKRYTKPIDESPETLYFFDVSNTTGSYTDQQLRAVGLRQTRSGKWYYKPIGNNTQAVDSIAQRLNVQPQPWTPVREGNSAADWPIFGESQNNAVASHTFADTGSAFRNGQEDAMNFRPKNDAKYIRGHKYRSNYSDGYKYGLTRQDRSINPKTGQPYVLFGPNGPTNDSDPERSMHGDGPHVWVCSSYQQAKKQADKWGQKVARAGVSKWKVVPKDDPAPEIFSESDLEEQGVAEGAETKIRAKNRAVVKKLQGKEVKEDVTKEDIITKLKAKLGDYLSDLGQQIRKDPALQDKLAAKPQDTMGPAVKTVTTDDGQTISIHGNEDDGFRISIKNKPVTAKFKTVDEAALACNMFNARRKNPRTNTDYMDEQ